MSQSNLSKWSRRSAYFLFGIVGAIVGYMLGYSLPIHFLANPPFISVKLNQPPLPSLPLSAVGSFLGAAGIFVGVTLSGAFGGLLYAIKEKKLELPYPEHNKVFNPGFLSDCLAGLAGAYVVFLIVPGTFGPSETDDPIEIIKVLGMAVVGGYGGRGLMDKVLDDLIAKRIEDKVDAKTNELVKKVEDKTEDIKEEVLQNRNAIDNNTKQQEQQTEDISKKFEETSKKFNKQAKIDADAMDLLTTYFDKSLSLINEKFDDLKQLIKDASPKQKADMFLEAKKVGEDARVKNKPLMIDRTIHVFKALADTDVGENQRHRIYAQLGYAFKAKSDWERAKAALTKAIKLRDGPPEKSLSKKASFWVYEFNQAICRIKLNENRDLILLDLRNASKLQKSTDELIEYQDVIDDVTKNSILKWVRINSPEDPELLEWLNGIFTT